MVLTKPGTLLAKAESGSCEKLALSLPAKASIWIVPPTIRASAPIVIVAVSRAKPLKTSRRKSAVLRPVRVWASRAVSVIAPSAAPPVPFESSFALAPISIFGAVSVILPPPALRITFGSMVMLSASV